MTESLKRCYKEVAEAFDEYISNKGISDENLTNAQIEQYIKNKGITVDKMFQAPDMCYNHTTKPLGNEDEFEQTPHIFEYLGWNKYKVLGPNYPYTGLVIRNPRNGHEKVIGEWLNGKLIKWEKSKLLDLNEIEDINKIQKIIDEIDASVLIGEDKKAFVKIRVNQSVFRKRLLNRYKHCCLCGVTNQELLIASHIKPWAVCNPKEKLNVNNGLLFCPNHDSLFDKGYISFQEDGKILISSALKENDKVFMNVFEDMHIEICNENKYFLDYHRENIFVK